jgi:hypothetical protein
MRNFSIESVERNISSAEFEPPSAGSVHRERARRLQPFCDSTIAAIAINASFMNLPSLDERPASRGGGLVVDFKIRWPPPLPQMRWFAAIQWARIRFPSEYITKFIVLQQIDRFRG